MPPTAQVGKETCPAGEHWWKQEAPGHWPKIGQRCLCGVKTYPPEHEKCGALCMGDHE